MSSGLVASSPVEVQAQAQPQKFTMNDLPTITHPCRRTACVFASVTGLSTGFGIIVCLLSATNPATFAVGIIALVAAGTFGISALCAMFCSTHVQDSIRILVEFCRKYYPDKFEQFVQSEQFARVVTLNADCTEQKEKDANVLNLLVDFCATLPGEAGRTALNKLRLFDPYDMRSLVNVHVHEICAKVGATRPFINAAESIYWGHVSSWTGRHVYAEDIVPQLVDFVPYLALMPEGARDEIMRSASCEKVLKYGLADKNVVAALAKQLAALEPDRCLSALRAQPPGGDPLWEHVKKYNSAYVLEHFAKPIVRHFLSLNADTRQEFIEGDISDQAIRLYLKNNDCSESLFGLFGELEPSEKIKLLMAHNRHGYTMAMEMAICCKLPGLIRRMLDLCGGAENFTCVLEHTAHNGNTFGTVLCGWGNTTEVIDFLEYVSKLDVEMRIKILSHRTSKRRNIYNMLQEHQNAPRVFAAFHACLGGMSEDQQALCSGEGYSPVHGLNKSD